MTLHQTRARAIQQPTMTWLAKLLRAVANRLQPDPQTEQLKQELEAQRMQVMEHLQARQRLAERLWQQSQVPALLAPSGAPDWTQEHQGKLKLFLESEAGRAMLARMRTKSYLALQHIDTSSADRTSVSAARCLGYEDGITEIERLSRVCLRDIEHDTTPAGAGEPEVGEHLTP